MANHERSKVDVFRTRLLIESIRARSKKTLGALARDIYRGDEPLDPRRDLHHYARGTRVPGPGFLDRVESLYPECTDVFKCSLWTLLKLQVRDWPVGDAYLFQLNPKACELWRRSATPAGYRAVAKVETLDALGVLIARRNYYGDKMYLNLNTPTAVAESRAREAALRGWFIDQLPQALDVCHHAGLLELIERANYLALDPPREFCIGTGAFKLRLSKRNIVILML